MNHVVFISHDANRTGAPIVLLHLLRWLKKQQVFTFSIILLRGGELESEFQSIAPTYVWHLPPVDGAVSPSISRRIWNRARRFVRPRGTRQQHEQQIIEALRQSNTQLIYANTVVSAELAVQLKASLGCPALCHVHELSMAIEGYFGTARFEKILPQLDLLVAASEAVKENLLATYAVAADKLVKVYEFIASPPLQADAAETRAAVRASLGIPLEAAIIVASGTFEWRKAPGLFIQIADYMRRNMEVMPYFLWIGGSIKTLAWQELQYDVEKLGLTDYVKFIGPRPNPLDYLLSAELFVLTSREDPYPLVCLEAAALGKPVLCFEQSGGMPEFVETDCGRVLPYLQIDAMARAIQDLLLDPAKRQELGSQAQRKVQSQHSVEVAGQQVVELLHKLIAVR
ncbi:glycosyltransferase family 4 protein [Hymenobacter sp. BT559]|uniref:glycosyltransferase family 4 protein n=1 Tax=Hymenobacter sp. BT559 TaxID=2795729 RepID=UPI0018EC4648|nr:glycosyltransferase family 4 protein [Hymenobacter sp. BT559]MBJ6141843.1 glycosyltransferase family 4 protein [Hymenobacter sp. BT559]